MIKLNNDFNPVGWGAVRCSNVASVLGISRKNVCPDVYRDATLVSECTKQVFDATDRLSWMKYTISQNTNCALTHYVKALQLLNFLKLPYSLEIGDGCSRPNIEAAHENLLQNAPDMENPTLCERAASYVLFNKANIEKFTETWKRDHASYETRMMAVGVLGVAIICVVAYNAFQTVRTRDLDPVSVSESGAPVRVVPSVMLQESSVSSFQALCAIIRTYIFGLFHRLFDRFL